MKPAMRKLASALLVGASAFVLAQSVYAYRDGTRRAFLDSPYPSFVLPFQPGLDLNFTTGKYFQLGNPTCVSAATCLTTTRASIGTAVDNSGNWTQFSNNVPRITNLGLTVEESRTNSIRNNTMQGAVTGSPGTLPTNWTITANPGLTQTVVGTGTENGIVYIDVRFNGTTNNTLINIAFETITATAAAQNQVWTNSFFYKLVGGTLTNVTSVQSFLFTYTNVPAFLNSFGTTVANPSGAALGTQRVQGTSTLTDATTAFVRPLIAVNVNNAAAVDLTLRIGWPQLELGSFASTPIPTINTAVTRAADVIKLATVPSFNAAVTMLGIGMPEAPTSFTNNQFLLSVGDGTNSNKVSIFRGSGVGAPNCAWSVAGVGTCTGAASPTTGLFKLGMSGIAGAQTIVANGGSPATATAAGFPTINQVNIGTRSDSGIPWDGTIAHVALWPTTALSSGQLVQLTSGSSAANDNVLSHDVLKKVAWN